MFRDIDVKLDFDPREGPLSREGGVTGMATVEYKKYLFSIRCIRDHGGGRTTGRRAVIVADFARANISNTIKQNRLHKAETGGCNKESEQPARQVKGRVRRGRRLWRRRKGKGQQR